MLETFRKLMDLLDARERRRFGLLILLLLVMGLANMIGVASVLPFLAVLSDPGVVQRNDWLAWLYDLSGAAQPLDFLLWLGVGAVLAYLGGLAFKALATYALLRFGHLRTYSLSRRMLAGYLGRPYAWFLGRHSSDLATNVLAEVDLVIGQILQPLLSLMANGMIVIFLLGLLIAVNPWIALFVALLLAGGYGLIYLGVRRWLKRLGETRVEANRERFQVAQEGLNGVKEVKVLGLERRLLRRFENAALRVAETSAVNEMAGQLPRNLLEAVAFGGMMVVVLVLAFLEGGSLSGILPVAGVYALAGSRMAPALQEVYRTLSVLRFGRPALDRLHADLVSSPAGDPPPEPAQPIRLRERLSLEGVSYAYPGAGREALTGAEMDIAAHTAIGIVGGTGAGKTTAVDVILGLLEPRSGRLRVDGRAIETEEERRAWRRSIGYVPQQIFLVDDTVAANIAFGLPKDEIDLEAVERAARMAELHRFVMEELPQGYDTRVGDRGVRLSGGQRQRIGIARALYHDPDVLVLDEATSALDNLTERAVMRAVNHLGGAKTIVMIAHRLSTVMNCDEIFLMERGRVAARGSYAQLIERNSTFRDMATGTAA